MQRLPNPFQYRGGHVVNPQQHFHSVPLVLGGCLPVDRPDKIHLAKFDLSHAGVEEFPFLVRHQDGKKIRPEIRRVFHRFTCGSGVSHDSRDTLNASTPVRRYHESPANNFI